jgi:hypothetical protein
MRFGSLFVITNISQDKGRPYGFMGGPESAINAVGGVTLLPHLVPTQL